MKIDKSQEISIKKEYFNKIAKERDFWKSKNSYYYDQIENICRFLIPQKKNVLELGSGTGGLLAALKPKFGLGVDISEEMVNIASKKYKSLKFKVGNVEDIDLNQKFDYILLSDLIGHLDDIQTSLEALDKLSHKKTRVIVTYYNLLWEPLLNIGEKLGWKMPQPLQNWLSAKDIENLINLAEYEIIKEGRLLLLPIRIPILSDFVNRYIARLPIFKHLDLVSYFVIRKKPDKDDTDYSVSVVIPTRNEKGNIEQAIIRTPNMGKSTEFIFVEGGSSDGTSDEIKRVIDLYQNKKIMLVSQGKGIGKGDAVRKGFAKASGDILMILDADLAVPPEELPKFYRALQSGKGDMVQGSRLVYALEEAAMRLLNILGNKFFGVAFTWLLDQPIKDTLCGTKVLFKEDYEEIARNRSYFGDFDPFGDFDLIFGASKLNMKILEIPIRYRSRTYGSTNISRFKHGWLLLKMTVFAARKIKFI